MISMVNTANELCASLGRYRYNYQPEIQTQVMSDGRKMARVACKAYPDREKEFHNILSAAEFEDKIFVIKEKMEKHSYAIEHNKKYDAGLAIDDAEGEIFGVELTNTS
jgi:hypothetical protein